MIQAGQLCRTCKRGKCTDAPTPLSGYDINCPTCEGLGCEHCDKRGTVSIEACPQSLLDHETWELLHYAELYKKGLPPVSGGALDQGAKFSYCATHIWHEQSRLRADLGLMD